MKYKSIYRNLIFCSVIILLNIAIVNPVIANSEIESKPEDSGLCKWIFVRGWIINPKECLNKIEARALRLHYINTGSFFI